MRYSLSTALKRYGNINPICYNYLMLGKKTLPLFLFLLLMLLPSRSQAAIYAPFEVSGWIPYWRSATGTAQFLQNIDSFKEINPFGYTVKKDGTLADTFGLTQAPWPALQMLAKAKQIRFIPT